MTDDRPVDDRWLTYIEASELLGISPEAVRALARRQKWPRQRPNAIGQPVRLLVPPDRARPPVSNGQSDAQPVTANGHAQATQRSTTVTADGHDQRSTMVTANGHDESVREAVRALGDAISSLGAQLIRERERADRAEQRAEAAEGRVAELLARRWWRWRR
jgi:hypothetical protein